MSGPRKRSGEVSPLTELVRTAVFSVWDAVVHSRRAADQVTFPLIKPDLKLKVTG